MWCPTRVHFRAPFISTFHKRSPFDFEKCCFRNRSVKDDTTIYDVQTDKATLNANLQTALNLLKTWCRENGMLLNTDKTKVMLLTSRQKRTTFTGKVLSLNFNNAELQLSNNEKVLGVYIDENFIWNTHFTYVSKKVSSNLWLLPQIKNYLS